MPRLRRQAVNALLKVRGQPCEFRASMSARVSLRTARNVSKKKSGYAARARLADNSMEGG